LTAACFGGRRPEPAPVPVREPTSPDDIILPSPVLPARYSVADSEFFMEHPLMVPVEGIDPRKLPDTFYEKRDGERIHEAQDILAPRGTPVLAAIDGKVLRMSQNTLGGITIYAVDSDDQYVFYYAHLDHYSDAVTVGLELHRGDVLGYVGTSGNAPPDTPHLHFQVMRKAKGRRDWWNGTPVDVRPFMTMRGEKRNEGQ
jgi:peptidoglycan LD-endopeptidase LytH